MVWSIFRIVFGFTLAALVAGIVQVAFVITPADVVTLDRAAALERLQGAGILTLLAATQCAVFASPFALLVILVGEWQRVRSALFYGAAGMAIAGTGFLAEYLGEQRSTTIVNRYALAAFLATGLAGGLTYWLLAGRGAGGRKASEKTPREQRAAAAAS